MTEEKPRTMPKFVTTKATVTEQFNITPRALVLRLKFPGIENFTFSEGQFANLFLENVKDAEGRVIKRSYSIASSPLEKNYLEFCYTVKEGNEPSFTKELAKLKTGDEINIQAAFGLFKLEEPFPEKLTFIGAGAGITPLMSMLRTLAGKNELKKTHAQIFYGFRCDEDFIYQNELQEFAKQGLELITAISCNQHKHEEWKGLKGRITKIVEDKLQHDTKTKIYMCGPPAMVTDTVAILTQKGFTKEQIKKEEW
ncbi:MAG: FAD-binding oxidoreductase [Candidatus Diapherotrites archaeon]|nr:FAD-binding oxidoreductase [Candidatus Diapherotrites archaeon]